jgi:hypothetical protein
MLDPGAKADLYGRAHPGFQEQTPALLHLLYLSRIDGKVMLLMVAQTGFEPEQQTREFEPTPDVEPTPEGSPVVLPWGEIRHSGFETSQKQDFPTPAFSQAFLVFRFTGAL